MRQLAPTLLVLLAPACGHDEAAPPSARRTVTVNGRVRSLDGQPLTRGTAAVDAWWVEFGTEDRIAKGELKSVQVGEDGEFSIGIDGVPRDLNWCRLRLTFAPSGPTWPFEEDRPTTLWDLKQPIPDELRWGAVPLHAPSAVRPFASLSDDDLEARVRSSWHAGKHDDRMTVDEWHQLLGETSHRQGARWEPLLAELLTAFLKTGDWNEREDKSYGQLELLTTIRRRQGKPDPIVIDVMRGSQLVVDEPAMPVLVARIVNRDVDRIPVSLTRDWFRAWSWRVEARLADGSLVRRLRTTSLGSSRVAMRKKLEAGEPWVIEIQMGEHLAPFRGPAEVHLTYSDRPAIKWETDLDGLILFHPDVFRVEVREPTTQARDDPVQQRADLWPIVVDDDRMRELAREAGVPLLERNGVLLVATDDCKRFVDVLEKHDALAVRVDSWIREEVGARREPASDHEFAGPTAGSDPDDGARSIISARFWIQDHGGGYARYVFHVREHAER